ncbi:ABC transporter permease [Brevibacillus sp. H7]|uniref:ABC transporter permease n=1 Tax=Brevibacillus sp. H7 TaxID=3349138 RepID=UPI00380132B9
MGLFFLLPLLLVLGVSFFTRSSFGGIDVPLTLENYIRFVDPLYIKILWVSCVLAFATTVLCLVFGYPFAYIIARSPARYRNILLLLIIVPFWTNSLIRTYAWIVLLRTEGVINTLLLQIGLIDKPLSLLYNETAVLIGLVYTMLPFMVLPLYASIEKLDRSLLEAAADLGAKPRQVFWKVTLPLTAPGIMAGSLLVFIPSLGLFFIPDLMGGSKTVLVGNLIKNQFLTARDWPFGSASSIILMVLTLLFITAYILTPMAKQGKELV